ncbi:MAG: serine dehydratase, partial [Calditrichaeota bacterium]
MTYPSIFNDVIGPVMRGPSSSHCAASLRIGRMCRDLMDGDIKQILIEFDPNGSLATTHESQGSDMGLFGGFLGWEAHDERLPDSRKAIADAGVEIDIRIVDIQASHPNTYKITLKNAREAHAVTALSTGGGMIEVIEIDGAAVSLAGDFYETLVYTTSPEAARNHLKKNISYEEMAIRRGTSTFLQVRTTTAIPGKMIDELTHKPEVTAVKQLAPVLPVLSRKNLTVPFITCNEMLAYNTDKQLELWQLAAHYESARGSISREAVFEKMRDIVEILRAAVDSGLQGTAYNDRILGAQSVNFVVEMQKSALIGSDVLNRIIAYVSAIMEVKSSMGVIVAAPTAGSCGALPGAVLAAGASMGLSDDDMVKGMLAAGLIGVFIAAHATFAAEVGGCQAECGSGSGMAAAALVSMAGGSLSQSLSAASMALQNSFGMVCDPIANRVEAPCLGKNVMAATNALSCANMALAGYNPLIPLD